MFSLESPFRGEYRLHRLSFGGGEGPVTALAAGVHGNEVNGVHALNLLAGMLRLQRPHGTVHLLPCVNLFGAEEGRKRWPFDDRDVNEAFPGEAEGSPVDRIAHAVLDASQADVCIELQTGSATVHEAPHARVPLSGPAFDLGNIAGLPIVWRREAEHIDDGLVGAWRRAGRTALELRAGRGGCLDVDDSRALAHAAVRILGTLGHLSAPGATPESLACARVRDFRTATGGFFVPEVRPGEVVSEGQLVGVVRAPLGGAAQEAVHADVNGIVLAVRIYPMVHAAERVVRVAIRE